MSYDLVIKQGTVVTASSSFVADIGLNGEKIAAIGANLSGEETLDATGLLVVPGGVDIHVHLQMPIGNFRSSDDFFSGTKAAVLGGTTTIIDFVETQPAERMIAALQARRALADPQVCIDYGLHMTITPDDIARLEQIPAVYRAGCTSFKLYMAYGLRLHDGQLLQALTAIRDVGGLPVVHAENWDVICALVEKNLANGRYQPKWHPRSRPAAMEGEAVNRVIKIATWVGTPVHIFHLSCAAAVTQIARARQKGLPVTGETCPQYLFLTQDCYDAPGVAGALPVCAPPIRGQAEQEALWQALQVGQVQLITTDHCPFLRAEKETGLQNFSQIPGGVPSIEMRLAAVYSGGVCTGKLSLNRWVDLCCTRPARLAGLRHKGDIAVGYDADLVLFNPDQEKQLSTTTLHEQVDWTPYEGMVMQGWPQTTLLRGQVVVKDGEFVGAAGQGRFIHRGAID